MREHFFNQNFPEYAVKNVWHLVKDAKDLEDYLPVKEMNEGHDPNKKFFWGIAFTIIPKWARAYHKRVLDNR